MRTRILPVALAATLACSSSSSDGPNGGGGIGVLTEIEPNNIAAQANTVPANAVVLGSLASYSDSDFFAVTVPAGTFLQARTLDASQADCLGINPLLEVYDPYGSLIAAADNNGLGSCEVVSIETAVAGPYFIEVLGVSPATFSYSLVVTTPSPPPAASEVEPNGTSATANGPFTSSALINGSIGVAGDNDYFAIANPSPAPARVHAETFVGGFGHCSAATGDDDTLVTVFDVGGIQVEQNDDGGLSTCSSLDFWIPAGQTRYVRVTDYWNTTIPSYQLWIQFF